MQKLLEKIAEQFAPDSVKNAIVDIREMRKHESRARSERQIAEKDLLEKLDRRPRVAVAV